jgi:hypothetical protein
VIERSESLDPMALELEDAPPEAEQIVTGDPRVSRGVLDRLAAIQARPEVARYVYEWRTPVPGPPNHRTPTSPTSLRSIPLWGSGPTG